MRKRKACAWNGYYLLCGIDPRATRAVAKRARETGIIYSVGLTRAYRKPTLAKRAATDPPRKPTRRAVESPHALAISAGLTRAYRKPTLAKRAPADPPRR